MAVSQDLTANNDCDATAFNFVICSNNGASNVISSIIQINDATGDGFAAISQNNDGIITQSMDLVNSCDESGADGNFALCDNNSASNFIGPVFQANVAADAAQSDTVAQSNGAQAAQNLDAVNDCNEANTGFNFAICTNGLPSNFIDSITQTNDAIVGDDTVQSNFVVVNQDMQLENLCDETGIGDNAAFCSNDSAANVIAPVSQLNDADGSGDADFTQNNNIPTINQVLVADNDCNQSDEQTADGTNFAICSNDDVSNSLSVITQTNDASATHVDDIFQDNIGSFSQVLTLNNGCDATTFTDSGDNDADCTNEAVNSIGPVLQANGATGLDDVLIDQDNNVAVSQDISANNDCDSTSTNLAPAVMRIHLILLTV